MRHLCHLLRGVSNDFSKYSVLFYSCFRSGGFEINVVAVRTVSNVEAQLHDLKLVRFSEQIDILNCLLKATYCHMHSLLGDSKVFWSVNNDRLSIGYTQLVM